MSNDLFLKHTALLRHLILGDIRWEPFRSDPKRGELCFNGIRHCTELDENGCPILSDELYYKIISKEKV